MTDTRSARQHLADTCLLLVPAVLYFIEPDLEGFRHAVVFYLAVATVVAFHAWRGAL